MDFYTGWAYSLNLISRVCNTKFLITLTKFKSPQEKTIGKRDYKDIKKYKILMEMSPLLIPLSFGKYTHIFISLFF